MVVEKKLDMEVLAKQDSLTEEQYKVIETEAWADPKEGAKEPVVKEEEENKEEKVKEETHEGETAEEKTARETKEQEDAKVETEKIAAENQRLLDAKPEDLSDEDKVTREALVKADVDAKAVKEAEDKKLKEQLDSEVKSYATEHKISEDEARTDFESREKILEKYKSDPKQLAMANLHLQRMYTKSQETLKAAEEAKPLKAAKDMSSEDYLKMIDEGQITYKDKVLDRESAISLYKENNPDITDGLEDEAVLKLVAKELKEWGLKQREKKMQETSAIAKEKRVSVINSLSDSDKKYLPEIQPILDKFPDIAILSEHFNVNELVYNVKGKHYDQDIKEFGDKEYKRGLAQARIVGQKGPVTQGSQVLRPKTSQIVLNDKQKAEALDMYEGTTFTDEEKFANYAELMLSDKK
jgi:hypothetical protein